MSPLPQTLLMNLVVIMLVMFALWVVSLLRRDVTLVDAFWGTGFVIVAAVAGFMNSTPSLRVLVLVSLTTIWGLRLSLFLLWRNWGLGEDRRYAAMRSHHGDRFWGVSLFTVFLLQAVILWFISLPIQCAAAVNSEIPPGWLDGAGITIWGLGLFFEAVGDWQLVRFKMDPNNGGRVMDHGLWKYTRHPNYFGDFCVWWGLYLIAAAGGAWFTIISPIIMSFLLMKVSGVQLLESTIARRRPEYIGYMKRTNAFFPGPAKPES